MLWCTSASLFPDRQSRANAAVTQQSSYSSSSPTITYYCLTNTTPTLRPYTYTPPPLQETPTISRSFYHPPTPPDCIFRQRHNSWSSPFRFVSPAKTNSLGHHHQKVRSQLQTAIDRNPRRLQTTPPPRGNDTALLRTRRCSKIANKQALASRSQPRGHSSASE